MKTRPKFCVGEEVGVTCFNKPNIPRTEITKAMWRENKLMYRGIDGGEVYRYTGWVYLTRDTSPDKISREEDIRKLPPEDRLSWEDCQTLLNQPEVEEA